MPELPTRKGFDILDEAEKIRDKQTTQPTEAWISKSELRIIEDLYRQWRVNLPRYSNINIWRSLLLKSRSIPKTEFIDDFSELRQEVDNLRLMVQSMSKTIESSNKTIDKLSKQILQKDPTETKEVSFFSELCSSYIEDVSKIKIVQKIYVVPVYDGFVCWTIVDSEPFDSKLLEPIYKAQVKLLRKIKDDLELDFHVLNLSELNDRQEFSNILPPNASLIWQR